MLNKTKIEKCFQRRRGQRNRDQPVLNKTKIESVSKEEDDKEIRTHLCLTKPRLEVFPKKMTKKLGSISVQQSQDWKCFQRRRQRNWDKPELNKTKTGSVSKEEDKEIGIHLCSTKPRLEVFAEKQTKKLGSICAQ